MKIDTVAVLGAGTMGHGIAQVCAAAGCAVRLQDITDEAVERGFQRIRANLDKGVEKGKVEAADRDAALERLKVTEDLEAAAGRADVIIEAAPEKLELKRDLFKRLDEVARPDALLASNTSSLPVGRIAALLTAP